MLTNLIEVTTYMCVKSLQSYALHLHSVMCHQSWREKGRKGDEGRKDGGNGRERKIKEKKERGRKRRRRKQGKKEGRERKKRPGRSQRDAKCFGSEIQEKPICKDQEERHRGAKYSPG